MKKQQTLTKNLKRLRLTKIVASFLLITALFFTTIFSSENAIAASSLSSNLLAAANKRATTYPTDDNQVEGLLYSDSDKVKSLDSVNDFVSPQTKKQLLDPTQIPAVKQPILDRSDPNAKLLEKTKQMFDEAADFSAN
jgi:hypothetical protein